jgi:hypothetical protein
MTPQERYTRAIIALERDLHALKRANPRPNWQTRRQIKHMANRLETLQSNAAKLKQAQDDAAVYLECVDIHGRENYRGALLIAERAVKYYERLAPSVEEV